MEKRDLKLAVRGRPGLLVLGLAAELSEPQADVESLALPLMVRDGGFLVAVPYGAFDQQVLLDGLADDADGDVGPNKLFESGLTAEAEDGSLLDLQKNCKFYVVDLKDDMLVSLRDYNPESDSMDAIVPFSAEDPYALPSLDGVIEKVRDWASSAHQGPRAAFYSAREEPDPTANGGPPKKAPARRVTTAALLDRVEALMSAATVRSECAEGSSYTSRCCKSCRRALCWICTSNSKDAKAIRCIESKYGRRRPCEGSCSSVSASSSEVRCSQSIPSCSEAWACYVRGRALHFLRSASGPYAHCPQPAEFGFDCACCALDCWWRGSPFGFWFFFFLFELYQHTWLTTPREVDGRSVSRVIYLFPSISAAALQENEPQYGGSEDGGGHPEEPTFIGRLSGEAWGFQVPKDPGYHPLDAQLRNGCRSSRRRSADEGALGFGGGIHRAMCGRPGRMVPRFSTQSFGRSPLQLFQDRHQTVAMHQRSFGGLVPPQWSTVAVAFLKEMEVLNTKKQDLSKKSRTAIEDAEDPDASPRRRPRFPKKPKAKPKADGA